MEAFLTTVSFGAISGITFIAYKHPTAYRRLFVWLVLFNCVMTMGIAGYSAGLNTGHAALAKFLRPEAFAEATRAIQQLSPGFAWVLGVPMAVAVYLAFLWYLPAIIGQAYPPERDK